MLFDLTLLHMPTLLRISLGNPGPLFWQKIKKGARHPSDEMRFDPQSLINLHPFITPEKLLEWAEWESGLFLEALGEPGGKQIYSRLAGDKADWG